ncbi:hypothetical protein, conserved [Leishmania donovani]|nr:hypothetical protein, conserved [Leishmania donovani]
MGYRSKASRKGD